MWGSQNLVWDVAPIFCSYSAPEAVIQWFILRDNYGPDSGPLYLPRFATCQASRPPISSESGHLTRPSRPKPTASRSVTWPLVAAALTLSAEPLSLTSLLLWDGALSSLLCSGWYLHLITFVDSELVLAESMTNYPVCWMKAIKRNYSLAGWEGVKPNYLKAPFKIQIQTSFRF